MSILREDRGDRTLAQQLGGAFRTFGALVATAFLVTAFGYGVTMAWLTPEFERSRIAVAAASDAHAAMLDEENGLRAYLMTRDPRFLDAYEHGKAGLTLEARHAEARVATTQAVEILEMLATHAATAIESARLHELTEERSQMDALTRLSNRRRLDEDLEAECKRCVRYGRPLSFVMLDVDHFKAFNDAHGHPQADKALQEVADVLAGCARTTDTAYRYGGEEFCVILRETTGPAAMQFAERVRQRVEQRFGARGTEGITASFGVAEFCRDAPTPRALVEAADAAMYDSKHRGRNRVTRT